jgi:hypothetical protein
MNGRAARALRRDVRRTVGEEAISIIDAQTNAINHQILPNLNASTARLEHVDDRLHALELHAHGSEDRIASARQECAEALRRLETRVSLLEGLCVVLDDQVATVRDGQRGLLPRNLPLSLRLRWLVCGR